MSLVIGPEVYGAVCQLYLRLENDACDMNKALSVVTKHIIQEPTTYLYCCNKRYSNIIPKPNRSTRNYTKILQRKSELFLFCLVVMRSVLLGVLLMDSTRTTKKAGRKKHKPRRGRRQRAKTNSRPHRGWGFLCLLFRGDPVWRRMIYRDVSHIMRCHKSDKIHRYIVSSISRTLVPVELTSRNRTLLLIPFVVSTTQAGKGSYAQMKACI